MWPLKYLQILSIRSGHSKQAVEPNEGVVGRSASSARRPGGVTTLNIFKGIFFIVFPKVRLPENGVHSIYVRMIVIIIMIILIIIIIYKHI
jgi:hypothetical protein